MNKDPLQAKIESLSRAITEHEKILKSLKLQAQKMEQLLSKLQRDVKSLKNDIQHNN